MIPEANRLIGKYRNIGILVDTNILLLHLVGLTNQNRIEMFKRTKKFTIQDFELLRKILCLFPNIFTTQSILTEVSNLTGQLNEPDKSRCRRLLREEIKKFNELYHPSSKVCGEPKFERFGLTDSGIAMVSRNPYLVLTDDLPLYAYLSSQNIDVLNFNHLRRFG